MLSLYFRVLNQLDPSRHNMKAFRTNNNAEDNDEHEMNHVLVEKNGDTCIEYDDHVLTPTSSKEKLVHKKDEYIQSFTVHGLTRICTGSKAESSFWLVMLLFGLVISVYVVYRLVSKYLRFEIYTEISQMVTSHNYFPAITFCDYNLLMATYFAYCGVSSGDKHNHIHVPCQVTASNKKNTIKNILNNTKEWSNGKFHVTQCFSWGSRQCANDTFLKSLSKHNHACFTWNYNSDFYDAYSHAYIQFSANKTADFQHSYIVALVHDPRIEELDMTNRVILEPAKTYELRIAKTVMKRLPSPYPSKCTDKKPNDIFPGKYTRRTCLESINYVNMFKKCGDVLDHHKEYIPADIVRQYKRNETIKNIMSCVHKFSKTQVEMTDDCPFPCEEMELQTMASFHEMSGKKDGENSIYRVDIQYQNVDSYRVVEEKMLFSWDQVIGEVGGLLGLVIGASFISFIEILAYLYLCCIQRCEKLVLHDNRKNKL